MSKPVAKKAAAKKASRKKQGMVENAVAPSPGRTPRLYNDNVRGARVGIGRRHADLMLNPSELKEWDDEELLRGYRRDKNGRWSGRPPQVVPSIVHHELIRRKFKAAEDHLRNHLEVACQTLTDIIQDPRAEHKDKLRAIGMLMDRVIGTAPQTVNVSMETPAWQDAIDGAVVVVADDEAIDTTGEEVA